MTERNWAPRLRGSIFAKLLAIMLAMAASLLLMVSGVFVLVVYPNSISMTEQVFDEYARSLAASSPNFETAKDLNRRLGLQTRYEGPDGTWETAVSLLTIDQVRKGEADSSFGRHYYVESAPNGGTYLFVWNFGRGMRALHMKLLWLLLFLMMAVVLTAYSFQKRLLRPVRSLHDGVKRLSAGHLDVVLPVLTRDEFGALTDAFNQMVRRVRQMIQARDQLLLDVSHELRSPLTRMKVELALLPDDDNRVGMGTDLNEMEAMITELLELERLRDGCGIRCERQDLVPILRDVAKSYEQRPPGIHFAVAPPQILLDIDGEKIRTVLRNIFENAAKYSLPNSRPVEVFAEASDDRVTVRISDDGPGIPDADISNLFEPFFRVDRSRSKKTGGYGLGLSICKRIMEAHGGNIIAQNNAGGGASFILTLPTAAAGQKSAKGTEPDVAFAPLGNTARLSTKSPSERYY
jgi:signal transduction histidine kinase